MRILVVGAGATGGYFGGLLARAGRDVTFLVRPDRAAALRERGLAVVTPEGDWTVQPSVVVPADLAGPFELILLAVKAYSLVGALNDLAPAVGPDTMILPGLNGMAHFSALAARFSDEAALGGLMIVSTTLDAGGRIVQFQSGLNELVFGDRQDPDSARILAVEEILQGAGFTARRSREIDADMWGKWVTLAAAGAMTCLMRGAVGEIVSAPGGRGFAARVIEECAGVAAASGFPLRDAQHQWTSRILTDPRSTFTSSMYRDLVAGHRTEVEQIIGDLVRRAAALGVGVPILSLAYAHLSIYENRLDGAPPPTAF